MNIDTFIKSKEVLKLIQKGKDQTYLSPDEINDVLPASIISSSEIDKLMAEIIKNQIEVKFEEVEEEEEGIKFDGTEIIEEALSKRRKG